MKKTLTFNVSTIESTASKINPDGYGASVEAYEKKNYLQSFHLLLDYVNAELRPKYGNPEGTSFSIPHGSIVFHITIEREVIKITAPFLVLSEKNRVPLLRQVATLNFKKLDQAQIILKDEQLQFEFSCPLALAHPYKIHYILQEICITGDKYDDEFSSKFGAVRVREPQVVPYDTQTVEMVYDTIQLSCRECMEGVAFFESERKYGYVWNLIACTLLKILYYAHPQGQLLNDLNKAVAELDRQDIPLTEITAIGKKAIEYIQGLSKAELAKELYYIETFVSPKRRSSLKNIQENFESAFKKISSYIEEEDYMVSCVMITYQFYNMYHYNDVQDDVNLLVVNALTQSSAKSWEEAAPILYEAMSRIMKGELTPAQDVLGGMNMGQYMETLQQNMQNINLSEMAKNIQHRMGSLFNKKK